MEQTFAKTLAPTPSFLSAASGRLSLTQQTVAGLAETKYGLTHGMTARQSAAAQAGMISSLTYPAAAPATTVATAVGVLATSNSTPESSSAPGCSTVVPGAVRRVAIVHSGTTYNLTLSAPESSGFSAAGSWLLPSYPTGGPTGVAVLDPNCAFSSPSILAVTYPGGIDFYDYTGDATSPFGAASASGALVPSGSWLGHGSTILTSAHVNANSSYVPVQPPSDPGDGGDQGNPGNAVLLVVTKSIATAGKVDLVVHRLRLSSASPTNPTVQDSSVTLASGVTAPSAASLAYDNNAGRISDYAVAARFGSGSTAANSVWFGEVGDGSNSGSTPSLQSGACAGTTLPRLAVADVGQDTTQFTGVTCTVDTAKTTSVQRWSNYTTNPDDTQQFPGGLHKRITTLPALSSAHPFTTWPCELINDYVQQEQTGAPNCTADMAAVVTGTPAKSAPRLYTLPTIGGASTVVSHAIAGGKAGATATVDQLPLDPTTITVHNTSTTATLVNSAPTPLVYLMPAPMIGGLVQPAGGPPVSFGTESGSGHGGSTSFTTSVGATVAATVGEPSIVAGDLSVSAERANGTSHEETTDVSTSQSVNDNGNEPLVVYTVTPQWRWTGNVTQDSTGIGTANQAKVVTSIAVNSPSHPPVLAADSVAQLGSRYAAFRKGGTYSATLTSVFGAGIFGGTGKTVANGDPGSYPTFVPGSLNPRLGGADYCDTHLGADGVTVVNSGVTSPYTLADDTASGPSFLAGSQAPHTVVVGDSASDANTVSVSHGATNSYSTDFSVSASAGITVGGVSVSANAGFSRGNETSVSTSKSQSFSVEIGHIKGASGTSLPAALKAAIDRALTRTETYTWAPFICHRTTSIAGGGQTSALVLGFATHGFTGLADVGSPSAPHTITGSTSATKPTALAQRAHLSFDRVGPAAAFRVAVQHASGRPATTLTTAVLTPAKAAVAARKQSVQLPKLAAGTYRWRVSAITYNGGTRVSGWRYFRVR